METKWEKERNYFPKLDDFFSFLFFRNSQLFYSFTIVKKKKKMMQKKKKILQHKFNVISKY